MVLAARGLRNLDSGEEKIKDRDEEMQLRRQANRVYIKATLTAIVLTLVSFYLWHFGQ